MFFPCSRNFIYVIIIGEPNLASATSLRGNIVIGDHEGHARLSSKTNELAIRMVSYVATMTTQRAKLTKDADLPWLAAMPGSKSGVIHRMEVKANCRN